MSINNIAKNNRRNYLGFTIVELLVVIVVIGILAAVTIVSYSNINRRAIISSLQSDLSNASKQFKMYQVDNSAFPVASDCTTAGALCLKPSGDNSFSFIQSSNSTNPQTFCVDATNNGIKLFCYK